MILDDWIEEKIKVKDNLDRQNLESYQLNTLNKTRHFIENYTKI